MWGGESLPCGKRRCWLRAHWIHSSGSFVLDLGGVGGLVWECPGGSMGNSKARQPASWALPPFTACPAGDLGFCLLLLTWEDLQYSA